MKTFKQFITEVDLSKTGMTRALQGVSYGQRYANTPRMPMVTTHAMAYLPKFRALQAAQALKPVMPNSAVGMIGSGLGVVASKLATSVAQQRREAQQKRLTSMVAPQKGEPGYYGSAKPAQIKPLNK